MEQPKTLFFITATAVLLIALVGVILLVRTGLPTADVIAEEQAQRIKVSDFDPGDVEIIRIKNLPIIVWRRDETDKNLAASQNTPDAWPQQYSKVLGRSEAVFADDANLTLDGEWFFALARFPSKYSYVLLRTGNFEGFFEGRYAGHFDLSGRIRTGALNDNLTVIGAEYSDDRQSIHLNLKGIPEN